MNTPLPTHPTALHPLTGQPLTAVGFSRRGPIWPIMGASDDDAGDDADKADKESDESDDAGADKDADEKPLGEAGELTLRKERNRANELGKELKPWKNISKDFGLTPEQAREALAKASKANKPDKGADDVETVDADEIRRQAKAEAREESDTRVIRSEIRALAAESFANPIDALHNLALADYEVGDDGELVDADQVKEDLAAVLKKNPHYAKKGKAPKADKSQGANGETKADPGPGMARLRHAYAESSK